MDSWGRRTFSAVERLEAVLDQVPAHRAVLRAVLLGLCREEVVLVLVHNAVLQSYMWVMHSHVSDQCELLPQCYTLRQASTLHITGQ